MSKRTTYADRLLAVGGVRAVRDGWSEATDDLMAAPDTLVFGRTKSGSSRVHLFEPGTPLHAALCGVTVERDTIAERWDVYAMFGCPACLKVAEEQAAARIVDPLDEIAEAFRTTPTTSLIAEAMLLRRIARIVRDSGRTISPPGCTSDNPFDHQGDTCPIHEEVST